MSLGVLLLLLGAGEPTPQENLHSAATAMLAGPGRRAQLFAAGFPLLSAKAFFGVAPWLDVGVAVDSLYSAVNEARLVLRALGVGELVRAALVLEVGWAWFPYGGQRAELAQGPRWLSGRRNGNAQAGVVLSVHPRHAGAARLFLDVRYHLALDLEPPVPPPLSGRPERFVLYHSILTRLGVEAPLSPLVCLLFSLGLDVHTNRLDAVVVPAVQVGLVTGL
jgi:hypothetical protein